MQKAMNRRSFVAGAAGVAAFAGFGAASAKADEGGLSADLIKNGSWSFEVAPEPVPEDQIAATYEADVIIIGAGISGLVCAASATEEGADVILFAASSTPVSRGGSNHGIGTKMHERLGSTTYNKDTAVGMIRRELARGGYKVDQKQWFRWINESAESMNWMIDFMEGQGYTTTMEIGYTDTDGTFTAEPGSHNWVETCDGVESGARLGENYVMYALESKILEQGGTIHYKTIARYLVRDDGNTGRVSAVVATDPDGNYVKYVGRKAVVMATGDFSANQDMMAKYCDWVAPLLQYNEIDYDAAFQFGGLGGGDGQKMGLWVGAAWQ